MDSRRKLDEAVAHVRRRLLLEWFARTTVRAMASGTVTVAATLAVSRLFVWPGYADYAVMAACFIAVTVFVYEWRKAPSRPVSVRLLDSFSQDNVILAAETDGKREGPLSEALADAAAEAANGALERFRNRKGRWMDRRPLLITAAAASAVAVLALFPSFAQLEAQKAEEERGIIEDLAENVNGLADVAEDPKLEKRLADVAEEIRSADSPEEAVREALKLQRELSLEDRLSDRPGHNPGQTAGERILAPGEAAAALAALSGDAEEQLAGMGRTSGAAEYTSDGEQGNRSGGDASEQEQTPSGGSGESGSEDKENSAAESDGAPGGNGDEAQNGGGNGTESGSDTGSGGTSGTGSGSEGSGGEGAGSGSEGSGYGSGSGDRNLVSTPQSAAEPGDPVLDSGMQKEGTSAAKSLVPAEKGEVRPYGEVQSEYRDAYVEHAGRLGLPEDLQQVLSDYFSSIDKRE
ncbi:hypothetical protein [Bhargavaea ginsengi]|uniref:hypothetical protein n=1 Tax=Bhargavaea ginsengi TaxID=426757 RepID=UPI003C7380F3